MSSILWRRVGAGSAEFVGLWAVGTKVSLEGVTFDLHQIKNKGIEYFGQ